MKKISFLILMVANLLLFSGHAALAQKGLYVGAGLGKAAMGGDIGKDFEAGYGYHFLLGFKPVEKWALELEYQAYKQEPKEENYFELAGYGGFAANVKYFLGRPRPRVFRPYLSAGAGLHAFVWRLQAQPVAAFNKDREDAIGAIALMPGIGCEVMVGRIAALNLQGRMAFNFWADETADGHQVSEDWSGNTLLLNLGLVLHL